MFIIKIILIIITLILLVLATRGLFEDEAKEDLWVVIIIFLYLFYLIFS